MASHTTAELRILFQRSVEEVREQRRSDKGVPPRSLQCASAVNDMLGMAVAYAIVDPRFTNVTKPKVRSKTNLGLYPEIPILSLLLLLIMF